MGPARTPLSDEDGKAAAPQRQDAYPPLDATWRELVQLGYNSPDTVRHYTESNQRQLTYAENALVERYLKPGDRVLVVGSGGGRELFALAQRGVHGIGIEIARQMIVGFRDRAPVSLREESVRASMDSMPFRPGLFGGVLLFNQVLSHGPSRAHRVQTLREALHVSRASGHVIVSFYTRTTVDSSVLLTLWQLDVRKRRKREGRNPGTRPSTSPATAKRIIRWCRDWFRGKGFIASNLLRGIKGGNAHNVLIRPTGPTNGSSVPLHLYKLSEFFDDIRDAGATLVEWTSNAELNAGRRAPNFLRGLDHLHFCVLSPRDDQPDRRDQLKEA